MHEDLEPLANLRINKVTEKFIEEMNCNLQKKTAEMAQRGLLQSGPMEAAKFDIRAKALEKECWAIADNWMDLLKKRKQAVTREDITFIMHKVEGCALTRAGQLGSVMGQQTIVGADYWNGQADARMRRVAGDIRRELEIYFREQEAFPQTKKEDAPMPSPVQVNIQNANISNLNLGTQVGNINAALQVLSADSKDHQEFAEAIRQLTEAVVSDRHLGHDQKHEAVDALSTLAKEAERGKGKPTVTAKGLLLLLPQLIGLSADMVTLWDKFGPTVRAFFGI